MDDLTVQGPSRRDVLVRGTLLAGATVWAAPTVQILSMGPASADLASGGDPDPDPDPCTPPPPTASAQARTIDVLAPAQTSGPAGQVVAEGAGEPNPGNGGPGPVSSTPTTGSSVTGLAMNAHTEAAILAGPAPDAARALATSTVEDFVLQLPGSTTPTTVSIETLTSTALAQVTSGGSETLTRSFVVTNLLVKVEGVTVETADTINSPRTITIPGVVELVFGAQDPAADSNSADRTTGGSITALRIRSLLPAPTPTIDVVVAKSAAQAAFPVCPPPQPQP